MNRATQYRAPKSFQLVPFYNDGRQKIIGNLLCLIFRIRKDVLKFLNEAGAKISDRSSDFVFGHQREIQCEVRNYARELGGEVGV